MPACRPEASPDGSSSYNSFCCPRSRLNQPRSECPDEDATESPTRARDADLRSAISCGQVQAQVGHQVGSLPDAGGQEPPPITLGWTNQVSMMRALNASKK